MQDLVMIRQRIEVEQQRLGLCRNDSFLRIGTGKAPNCVHGVPQGKNPELGDGPVVAPKHVRALAAKRLDFRKHGSMQERDVCFGVGGARASSPAAENHQRESFLGGMRNIA